MKGLGGVQGVQEVQEVAGVQGVGIRRAGNQGRFQNGCVLYLLQSGRFGPSVLLELLELLELLHP